VQNCKWSFSILHPLLLHAKAEQAHMNKHTRAREAQHSTTQGKNTARDSTEQFRSVLVLTAHRGRPKSGDCLIDREQTRARAQTSGGVGAKYLPIRPLHPTLSSSSSSSSSNSFSDDSVTASASVDRRTNSRASTHGLPFTSQRSTSAKVKCRWRGDRSKSRQLQQDDTIYNSIRNALEIR